MKTDRFFGYLIILLFLVASGIIIAVSFDPLFSPREKRWVDFGHVGDLRVQDDVKLLGVSVGSVSEIRLNGNKALIRLEFYHPIHIYRNYSLAATDSLVITSDKGMLGDRIIHLDPGDSTQPEIPPSDTLRGIYCSGISEMVGQAWRLRDMIRGFQVIANELLQGSSSKKAFVTEFNELITSLDSVTTLIADKTAALSLDVKIGINSLGDLTDTLSRAVHLVDSAAPHLIGKTDSFISKADSLAVSADSLVSTIDSLTSFLASNPLIADDTEAAVLRQKISDIQKNLEFLASEAADLKLIFVR